MGLVSRKRCLSQGSASREIQWHRRLTSEGAVFCICIGSYLISRPSWLVLALAIGQFLGVSITQGRRTYVGTAVVLVILVLFGEAKKFAKLFILVPAALVVVFLATTCRGP